MRADSSKIVCTIKDAQMMLALKYEKAESYAHLHCVHNISKKSHAQFFNVSITTIQRLENVSLKV